MIGGLYGILDVGVVGRSFVRAAAGALADSGARVIQLRAEAVDTRGLCEIAEAVQPIATRGGARFLIGGRADVAAVVGADGVHLGQDDLPAGAARDLLGPTALIGVSTRSEAQADRAFTDGVCDYIAFGPIFDVDPKTDTDPPLGVDRLRGVCDRSPVPVVAIGGITPDRYHLVLDAGASAVAMIGAVREVER